MLLKSFKYLLFLLIPLFSSYPQDMPEYFFKHIRNEDGLSQSTVRAIIQDSKGYMWFGTGNGLNRYDGYTFKVFYNNPADSSSISGNGIASIYEDKEGYIWVGTIDGLLNKYNRQTNSFERIDLVTSLDVPNKQKEQFYDYPISFSRNNDNAINTIAEDSYGYLWLGTWGKGVIRYNKNNGAVNHYYNHPTEPGSLSHNRIMKIIVDRNKQIWIGTFGGGLNTVETGNSDEITFERFLNIPGSSESLSENKVISLMEDSDGDIWIGTYHGGLNRIKITDSKGYTFEVYKHDSSNPNSLSNNIIMSLLEDLDGHLWIGTFGGGLNRFEKTTGRFLNYKKDPLSKNSLADNDVLSLCQDRSGTLWIGTHLGQGISLLLKNVQKFGLLKKDLMDGNSLSDEVVWSILKDNKNNLWIGTYRGGLNKYDRTNNKFTVYKNNPSNKYSISDNHIRALYMDSKGNLWAGTYSGGLNKFVPSEERFYRYINNPDDKKSIGANQILNIEEDKEGVLWIAAFGGGLNKFLPEENEFKSYLNDPSDESSLRDDRVYTLHHDRKGNLWVGTFGGGLGKFNKKTEKFINYIHKPEDKNSISNNRVMTVYEDSNGTIWIGTHGGGLNKLDPQTNQIKRYGKAAGLSSDVVYGILEDQNKNIWLSSEDGIFRMNLETEYISHFDIQDGLQGLEYSGGAYFRAEDGELFFGGINGLNYFYPENIVENQYTPPVVITSVKIFNEPLNGETDSLELKYNQNFITFEFAALDFTHPPDNHYQFMLEGLDEKWQNASPDMRVATYTNLAPGEYIFRVKGSNNDDRWNNVGTAIKISILPPFWKTWWFIALAVILVGFAIYYLSTIRIKNQLSIERLKTKLAADLHDNVGSGLTEISILSELAKNNASNGGSNELKHISEISRHLVDNMSDIVWVVNPRRDSLYDLIIRLKDSYGEMLSSMGISFKTQNLEKISSLRLPMEYRQNLYLIFKEAINNCIKHSGCQKLTLESNLRGDVLEIALKDDGTGFDPRIRNSGDGLKNMEHRAEEIGGKVKWRTSPEEGTSVIFLGRVPKSEAGFRRKKIS